MVRHDPFPLQGPGSGDEEEEESKNDSEGTLSSLVSPPGSPSLDRRLTSQWNQMDTKVTELTPQQHKFIHCQGVGVVPLFSTSPSL